MKGLIRNLCRFGTISLFTVLSSQAFASGYRMEMQSPSVLSDGGDAAVINDAGTNWFNSAGLVYLPQQFVGSATEIFSRTQYTGNVNAPAALAGVVPGVTAFNVQGSANSNQNITLPAIHYSLPFRDNRFAIGISVVPAWGLAENYDRSSFVRYELTRIYTKTIDIAPSIAFKINDKWSVGAGPDFNYLSIQQKFNANIGYPAVADGISRISADDWNTGWHAGVLFRINDCTRVGLNYRAKNVMHLTGSSSLFGVPGLAPVSTNSFTFNWVLPPSTSLSGYRDLNERWAVMGTLTYDQWSQLRGYSITNYMSPTGPTPVYLPQGFKDTVDVSVGTHFRLNEKLLFRGSFKYEPTPTSNLHRDINFPDGAKYGLNFGGRYQFMKKLAMDVTYAHVFTQPERINPQATVYPGTVRPITGVTLSGHTTTSIDILGASLIWNI